MNYHNITHEDMLNGDGLRVVLWVAGCNHYCKNCQNPITWDINGGIPFDKNAIKEIVEELSKDYCSGITFSGGDPLHPYNRKEILNIIENVIKPYFPNKTIWIYTGYKWEELLNDMVCNKIIKLIDVLVDGEYIQELNSPDKHWVGSSNQRVIDCKKSLAKNKIILKEN